MNPSSTIAGGEAAILTRVIKPDQGMSASAARAILRLDFDPRDRDRMHELAVKNQEAALTADERAELDSYVHVGLFLDLIRSKARRSLKPAASGR